MLHERGETASPHGSAAFAVLLMQDLAVVPLLALVPLLAGQGSLSPGMPLWQQVGIVVGMIGLVLVFGRYRGAQGAGPTQRGGRTAKGSSSPSCSASFVAAWATQQAGLSMALGAFLMGMLLSGSRYRYQIQAQVEPYKGLLMSLFFVAVGMSIDLQAVAAQPGQLALHDRRDRPDQDPGPGGTRAGLPARPGNGGSGRLSARPGRGVRVRAARVPPRGWG